MNRKFLPMLLLLPVLDAQALSLREAANKALEHDPRVHAAGAAIRGARAQIEEARAGYRPDVKVLFSGGRSDLETSAPFPVSGGRWPNSESLEVSQPLYTGGRTGALVDAAGATAESAHQQQRDTGGKIILAAVTAYLDVVRDRSIVALNQSSVTALAQAAADAQKRYEAGEATTTDVAQAQARLAEAQAGVQRALAQLHIAESGYRRVVGDPPQQLREEWPVVATASTLEEAIGLSAHAPFVLEAEANALAAQSQIGAVRAEYQPRVSLDGSALTQDNTEFGYDRLNTWAVQIKLALPIYQGGLGRAKTEEADARAEQARYLAEDARAQYAESAAREWASLQAAEQVIHAYESQVQAADLALDGVRKEQDAGTRTTLDLLNAQREQLAAQINLLGARRDRAVAAFRLLAVCGKLEPEAVPD